MTRQRYTPADLRKILAAVVACPHRGASLPHERQPYARGCNCPELWGCSAGKGKRPEGASLEECVSCRVAAGAPWPGSPGSAPGS